jgi:hypothetical protein
MKREIDDPVKSSLLKKSAQYREDLEDEAKVITDRTEKIITNALIVGGSLALTYFLYRQFSGGGSKKNKTKAKKVKIVDAAPEIEEAVEKTSGAGKLISQIGTALVSQASVFLLSMAKEKLAEYLQAQEQKKTDERS